MSSHPTRPSHIPCPIPDRGEKIQVLKNEEYRKNLGWSGAALDTVRCSLTDLPIDGNMYFTSEEDIKRVSHEIGGIQIVFTSTEVQ